MASHSLSEKAELHRVSDDPSTWRQQGKRNKKGILGDDCLQLRQSLHPQSLELAILRIVIPATARFGLRLGLPPSVEEATVGRFSAMFTPATSMCDHTR